MTTKIQLLLLTIFGNVLIATTFLVLSNLQQERQEEYGLDSSASLILQAWTTASNQAYESVGEWDPITGSFEKRAVWQENSQFYFSPDTEVDGKFSNPVFNALASQDKRSIAAVFDGFLVEDVEDSLLSYAMVISPNNELLYCRTAMEGYGVDPCSDSAQPDFLNKTSSATRNIGNTRSGVTSRRTLVEIRDQQDGEQSTLNESLFIEIRPESDEARTELLGTVVIGKNLFETLEMFEYDSQIKTTLHFNEEVAELNSFLEVEEYSGLEDVSGLVTKSKNILAKNIQHLLARGSFGYLDEDLGVAFFGFPVSTYAKGEKAQLVVLKDERSPVQALKDDYVTTLSTAIAIVIAVLLIALWLTNYAFGGISKAITVLQSLTEGNLDVQIPKVRKGLLHSKNDEVDRLSTALDRYRSHLVEMDQIKREQKDKRRVRDEIILEKMGLLADQLEGEPKRLLLEDLSTMRRMSDADAAFGGEDSSTEMMSLAFTRMSEEVSSLIDARTKEMREAHELASAANQEIQSSINYAAKLQQALLRAEKFPDDFKIHLTWQPRDIVGGDIYVVRTTADRTIIAVIDCTGHGVPGAFTSIIARSVFDRAIEDESVSTAGDYLSVSNRLIKDMLFQNNAELAESDAGFDGTVCILDRSTNTLEFAGANSSLLMLNNGEVVELKGDRRSVGALRTKSDFAFSTQRITDPSGMFVMLTDGVTDVMNREEQPIAFGRRRLVDLLKKSATSDPKHIVTRIIDTIEDYRGNTPLRDDLTLLAFFIDEKFNDGLKDVATAKSIKSA